MAELPEVETLRRQLERAVDASLATDPHGAVGGNPAQLIAYPGVGKALE